MDNTNQNSPVEPQTPTSPNIVNVQSNAVPTPPTYQSPDLKPPPPQEAITGSYESQKKPSFMLPLVLSIIFLTIIAFFGAGSYAVAYQKIKLPDKYQNIEFAITNFVQSLSFTPKTPEFLIAKALLAQEKVNKESYDVSLALDSGATALIPGLGSSMDVLVKGNVDYSDRKNIVFTADVNVTKDLNVELRKPDNLLFFKIGKIPGFLLAFAGLKTTDFDPILNRWYSYDTAPLSTEARSEIDEKSGDREVFSDKFVKDNLDSYIDERILSEMKISDAEVDGFSTYKLTITADADLIDYIGKKIEEEEKKNRGSSADYMYDGNSQKLSDTIKSMNWELNIDKKEYYVRKVAITTKIEFDEVDNYSLFMGSPGLSSENSAADIAVVAKFSDFGKDVKIEMPADAKSWEEFTNTISEIFEEQYQKITSMSPVAAAADSRDAKRKQDLMVLSNALEAYKFECGVYPTQLQDLTIINEQCNQTSLIMSQVPVDPSGSAYFYAAADTEIKYDLCANFESIPEDGEMFLIGKSDYDCPDTSYNYHLTSP